MNDHSTIGNIGGQIRFHISPRISEHLINQEEGSVSVLCQQVAIRAFCFPQKIDSIGINSLIAIPSEHQRARLVCCPLEAMRNIPAVLVFTQFSYLLIKFFLRDWSVFLKIGYDLSLLFLIHGQQLKFCAGQGLPRVIAIILIDIYSCLIYASTGTLDEHTFLYSLRRAADFRNNRRIVIVHTVTHSTNDFCIIGHTVSLIRPVRFLTFKQYGQRLIIHIGLVSVLKLMLCSSLIDTVHSDALDIQA